LFYFTPSKFTIYLEWVERKALGWPYSLAHEPIMVANVIQHLFSIKVVDSDGVLRRCTGGREGGRLVSLVGPSIFLKHKIERSLHRHTPTIPREVLWDEFHRHLVKKERRWRNGQTWWI